MLVIKSENMTSSGENGLNIRTNASPKMGQDQVSGGVSVLCWLAAKFTTKKETVIVTNPQRGPFWLCQCSSLV